MEKSTRPDSLSKLQMKFQIVKKGEALGKYCFYIGVGILVLVMMLGHSVWEMPYRGRVLQLVFGLFCIKILLTEYSVREWMAMILLGILGCASYFVSGEEYVISVIVMIFAAKHTDIHTVVKWIFYGTLFGTICIILLSLLQVGGTIVDVRDYGRGGIENRWCLGFSHANNLHGTLWYLTALFLYLFFDRLKWTHYVCLTALNVGLFLLTISKAGLIASQILIIAVCIVRYYPKIEKMTGIYILGILCIIGIIGISLASVTICWMDSPILQILDRLFTGRINLAYQGAHISNWRLLSHTGELGIVDNGWITIFFNYGYLIGILFAGIQIYLIYAAYKQKNGIYLAILVTNAFYTFMEATYTMNDAYFLCNLSYVTAMMLMGDKHESERLKTKDKRNIFGIAN